MCLFSFSVPFFVLTLIAPFIKSFTLPGEPKLQTWARKQIEEVIAFHNAVIRGLVSGIPEFWLPVQSQLYDALKGLSRIPLREELDRFKGKYLGDKPFRLLADMLRCADENRHSRNFFWTLNRKVSSDSFTTLIGEITAETDGTNPAIGIAGYDTLGFFLLLWFGEKEVLRWVNNKNTYRETNMPYTFISGLADTHDFPFLSLIANTEVDRPGAPFAKTSLVNAISILEDLEKKTFAEIADWLERLDD